MRPRDEKSTHSYANKVLSTPSFAQAVSVKQGRSSGTLDLPHHDVTPTESRSSHGCIYNADPPNYSGIVCPCTHVTEE